MFALGTFSGFVPTVLRHQRIPSVHEDESLSIITASHISGSATCSFPNLENVRTYGNTRIRTVMGYAATDIIADPCTCNNVTLVFKVSLTVPCPMSPHVLLAKCTLHLYKLWIIATCSILHFFRNDFAFVWQDLGYVIAHLI